MKLYQKKGAVFNVVGGPDLTIGDVSAAASIINDAMSPNSMIIFGSTVDETLPVCTTNMSLLFL